MGLRLTPRSQQLANLGSTQQQAGMAQQQATLAGDAAARSLQEAARQATAPGTATQIQQAGAAVAGAQAAGQMQATQQAVQQQGQLQQAAVQQRGVELNAAYADRQRQLEAQKRLYQRRIFAMDRKLGEEIFVKQMAFRKDEYGRMLFNERQLADFKLMVAQDKEEWYAFQQKQQLISKRKLQFIEVAQKKAKQKLEQEYLKNEQEQNHEATRTLKNLIQKLELDFAREQAAAANRQARNGALGSLVGLAVGAVATVATGGAAAPLVPGLMKAGESVGRMA